MTTSEAFKAHAPLQEFAAIATPRGEPAQERTTWATCSMEVLMSEVERLAREGVTGARIEVRALS
jgi:hypothetical protein